MSNVELRKTSEPSKRSMTSSMAAAEDGDEENDEETRLLTGRSHSRSLSYPLEVETSAWTSRRSTAEDLASGDHKSRGSCAMTSYKGSVRRRRLTMSALVFVVFLPLITYLVVLIILGFVAPCKRPERRQSFRATSSTSGRPSGGATSRTSGSTWDWSRTSAPWPTLGSC